MIDTAYKKSYEQGQQSKVVKYTERTFIERVKKQAKAEERERILKIVEYWHDGCPDCNVCEIIKKIKENK